MKEDIENKIHMACRNITELTKVPKNRLHSNNLTSDFNYLLGVLDTMDDKINIEEVVDDLYKKYEEEVASYG